jgi:hypothetical protein
MRAERPCSRQKPLAKPCERGRWLWQAVQKSTTWQLAQRSRSAAASVP